ncbi:MAG: isopentenyl-diphosphate Delta-isomerase [Silicimonas sp.]|nr:isopentenyl-diphosphate Delta-isomerase [Silicimonas sp.]
MEAKPTAQPAYLGPTSPTGDPSKVVGWVDGCWTPVDKLEAHRKGIRHKAVSVFVIDDGRLLLQQRALAKYHSPGLWANTCCTHPLWFETPLSCAERRLKEELGLEGLNLVWRENLEYRAPVGGGMTEHEDVDVFVADWKPGMTINPNPDEVAEVRWTTLPDLLDDLAATPETYAAWLRIYLDKHREGILGTRPA